MTHREAHPRPRASADLGSPASTEATVRDHCDRHGLLRRGRPLLVLFSGGPDSTCALSLLARMHDGPLHALVVDHGLRPESAPDASSSAGVADGLGVSVETERVRVGPGASIQDRARAARWHAAHRAADRIGAEAIATGHTADDQAETVLFRMARGTGRTGALGMAPRDGRVVRPLLCLRASETREWCRAHGLPTLEDPSNRDLRFSRARVRHELMPALEDVHPGAASHLVELAELLREEADLLEPVIRAAWERCELDGGLSLERVAQEPPASQRLLVRRLLERADACGEARARRSVERVLGLLDAGTEVSLPGGARARRHGGVLTVARPAGARPDPVPLPVPGRVEFDTSLVSARRARAESPAPDRVAVRVDGPFQVRATEPGDRLPLADGSGRQRVGRLLAAAGVRADERGCVPVVSSGERVIWVAGHRADPTALAAPGTDAVVLELSR